MDLGKQSRDSDEVPRPDISLMGLEYHFVTSAREETKDQNF